MKEISTIKNIILSKQKGTKFLFFSGKGGVGKTTISSSTAVWLAHQGFKVLILSTDLQKSLNDVFEQDFHDKPSPIKNIKNLDAVTIDTAESIERHRKKIVSSMILIDPTSPLLKQIEMDKSSDCGCAQAAIFEFGEYLNMEDKYDYIVFDTAPVGSTLEKIGSQAKYVLNLISQIDIQKQLLETIGAEGIEQQIKEIEKVKEKDEQALENLRSDKTIFIMVMIPEHLPLMEVERSMPVLEVQHKIIIRGIVINNIIPKDQREVSDFWKKKWAMQDKYINLTYDKFKTKAIGKAYLYKTDLLGIDRLDIIGKDIFGGN